MNSPLHFPRRKKSCGFSRAAARRVRAAVIRRTKARRVKATVIDRAQALDCEPLPTD